MQHPVDAEQNVRPCTGALDIGELGSRDATDETVSCVTRPEVVRIGSQILQGSIDACCVTAGHLVYEHPDATDQPLLSSA
jgi:hypothetical protein